MTIYKTKGVCSQEMHVELDGDIIKDAKIIGGCNGNTQGVAALIKGMKAEDAIARMEGIQCGFKGTSCPDQMAKAIRQALQEQN